MVSPSLVDLLNQSDPISIGTQILILLYLAYETRRGKIKKLENMVITVITVVRAMARTSDDINEEKVDKYLLQNGVSPDHFITDISKNSETSSDDSD
jgi:hypothetical protein